LEKIEQKYFQVPNFNTKINLLNYLLNQVELQKVLVFVSTKKMADIIAEKLHDAFPDSIGVIHSNKSQNNRFATVQQFNDGEITILIATDLVARGIDISDVTHVINFDTPEIQENYMHRIGRTGRADKKGISITFNAPYEISFKEQIEAYMNHTIELLDFPEEVEISNELIPDEQPKVNMPTQLVKLPKRENVGPSFHEKKEKNKKINVRKDYKKIKEEKRKARRRKK
jgi:ATP-dependent RNA helicase RhlE